MEAMPGALQAILLDAGPLGMVSHPEAASRNAEVFEWFARLLEAGVIVEIPEISDYEVRRELMRAGKSQSVARRDELAAETYYRPLTTTARRRAASLWARVRNEGMPTAPAEALDADVILAAQALEAAEDFADEPGSTLVATTNPRHLSRFVDAREWHEIAP